MGAPGRRSGRAILPKMPPSPVLCRCLRVSAHLGSRIPPFRTGPFVEHTGSDVGFRRSVRSQKARSSVWSHRVLVFGRLINPALRSASRETRNTPHMLRSRRPVASLAAPGALVAVPRIRLTAKPPDAVADQLWHSLAISERTQAISPARQCGRELSPHKRMAPSDDVESDAQDGCERPNARKLRRTSSFYNNLNHLSELPDSATAAAPVPKTVDLHFSLHRRYKNLYRGASPLAAPFAPASGPCPIDAAHGG